MYEILQDYANMQNELNQAQRRVNFHDTRWELCPNLNLLVHENKSVDCLAPGPLRS